MNEEYYLIRPNIIRAILPSVLLLGVLSLVLVLGILINFSLLDVVIGATATTLFFLAGLCLFAGIPVSILYASEHKIAFYFYADRLMFNSFPIPYSRIAGIEYKRARGMVGAFDALLGTGTVLVSMYDEHLTENRNIPLEHLDSPKEMHDYLVRVVAENGGRRDGGR